MKLNEIEELWSQDCQIDPDNLHLESLKIPSLHSKYYNIYNNVSILRKEKEIQYDQLYKEKWLYYSGRASPEIYKEKPFGDKILKQDLDKYLYSDGDLIKIKAKIDYYQLILKFLESIIKNIENRSFTIKNSIEFMKFIGGYS
jgi:hypothetical protein